ncbi:MAG: ASKHA domain-containing protein [Deltaproteobacteria bacterium]|nr:ASKHA domain-containing protein [Deltaproteobacteria bacterium]
MTRYTVTFFPNDKAVDVEEGTTLLEAAHQAEVFISNLCGGEGVCGRCRVQISKGKAEAETQAKALFSPDEIMKGYVLACQTPVHDHLEVIIPPESTVDDSQILTSAVGEEALLGKGDPVVRKIYLELPPPTTEDNVPDFERISRVLNKEIGSRFVDTPLDCLQHLSDKLRDNEWKITVTVSRNGNHYDILKIDPLNTADFHYGVAVDVGTTTVVAQLIDLNTGRIIGSKGSHNNQASYGEDVISRMIYACKKGGLDPVHKAVIKNINQLIRQLCKENDLSLEDITCIVTAGNTTMTHFLLGLTPCSIRLDPYVPTARVFPQIRAEEIGIKINPKGILESLPAVASYVGGDIVAGVMACGMTEHEAVTGLIDIGTNGEIAIGNKDWLVCCSASAGPAFEGGGTRCGMRAKSGAIENLTITEKGVTYETVGHAKPVGICGSGLISTIYELVRNHIIGQDGKFDRKRKDDRLRIEDDIPLYVLAPADETESGVDVVITETDIDNLIKSKGAVFAAIKSLLDYIGLGFDQIETFYVAGGFGNYLDVPKAVAIGLLPDLPHETIQFIGNSSLTGARMCLLSEKAIDQCAHIASSMTNIELSTHLPFTDEYIAALFLPHTNQKLFPSVRY